MKKRLKLIATIACLTLAVGLMAFGVYAATTVSYTISSSVTYTFSDALIKVTRTVSTVSLAVPPGTTADLSELTYTAGTPAGFQTYDENNTFVDPTVPTGFNDGEWTSPAMTENIDFNFNTSYAYKVEIAVETKNTNGVSITYTLPTATGENYRIQADDDNIASGTTITPTSGSTSLIYYISLIDQTIEVETDTLSTSFSFSKV